MRRTHLVAALLAVAATVIAPPVAVGGSPQRTASTLAPHPAPLAVTGVRTVRLITGDRVRVMTRADGSTVSTIVAGPHAGSPVARWGTDRASYLMPRTPVAEQQRLDVSLFNVSRLAQMHGGRVPVVVTLRKHAAPSALRAVGDALDLQHTPSGASARVAGTALSIRGAYPIGFRGLDSRELQAVRSVRLGGSAPTSRVTGPTHALTVQVRTAAGHPASGVVAFIENVDNADTYLETPSTDEDGNVTVNVPEGDYSVLAWNFSKLLVAPEVTVSADSVVALSLADATVRPHVSLPDYRVVEAVLSVGRAPDTGFAFPLQFSGPRFDMRVQPTSGHVSHGSLHTGVSAKLVRVGSGPAQRSQHLAVTADVSRGVPDDLSYTHHKRDFARVVQRFFGNGPAGLRQTYLDAASGYVNLWTMQEYDTPMPGRRVVLLQAGRNAYFQQTALPQAAPGSDNFTQLLTVRRYLEPGSRHVVTFAHGPVGPGVEGTSPFAGVTRHGGHLRGFLPVFSGAGSSMVSYVAGRDGAWSLRQGDHLLRQGRHEVSFDVAVPARRRAYALTAVSHPTAPDWELSTHVEDVWTFHSRKGVATPPLLTPSYVPPSSMTGYVRPGRTGFRLTFSSPPRGDRVTHATVELSTDGGRRWTRARLVRTAASTFRVGYSTPAARATHKYMSVRVTGRDAHGNSVQETALNVYRLR